MEALAHPFFDELRDPNTRLSPTQPLPELFNFTEQELSQRPDLNRILIPPHAEAALRQRLNLDLYLSPNARPVRAFMATPPPSGEASGVIPLPNATVAPLYGAPAASGGDAGASGGRGSGAPLQPGGSAGSESAMES